MFPGMRQLILKMSMTLDGFVAGPKGEIDWIFRSMDERATAWTVEAISKAGLHIMGSRTYKDMASFWPSSTEPFAKPMNEIPKAVFSRGGLDEQATTRALEDAKRNQKETAGADVVANLAGWTGARVLTGDLAEEIGRLKREPGGDIIAHGGVGFARSLVGAGLVDQYSLLIHPVTLGRGLSVFADLRQPLDLRLVSATAFPAGSVAHIYHPAG